MKCKNCKADNKLNSICDAGVVCYVLRCGEYGCALNEKTVDILLRMKKAVTNADRIRAMDSDHLIEWFCRGRPCGTCPYNGVECGIREWLKQEEAE